MVIQRYFSEIRSTIEHYAATSYVLTTDINFESRPGDQGYLHGSVYFIDGSILHFKEFLDGTNTLVEKLTYSYHYQDANRNLIFRYDNAAHKPALPFSEHKHLPQQILPAPAPMLADVFTEIIVRQN